LRPDVLLSIVSLAAALGLMLGELVLSRSNETTLRRRGAIEPAGDVYRALAWAYPMMFVAMAIEGGVAGRSSRAMTAAGVWCFSSPRPSFWAISTLARAGRIASCIVRCGS
jgi:isoprenylcysteine carboxyl methyltransferase (ICMT) family protein YpbQ